MPAQSTLNADEKGKVKAAIPAPSNKIFFAALARIYYAHPVPSEWAYAGLQGALAIVRDASKANALFFRLVDLTGTRGVIWEHELYQGFEYNADRAYFHSFAGDVSGGGLWRGWAGMLINAPEMHDRVRVCGRERGEDVREEGDEAE